MKNDEFVFARVAYLADTNAEGNVYFARFFEWQGMAREEFFRSNVPDCMKIMQSGIRIITKNAWMVFQHEGRLFDDVEIRIQTSNLKPMSLELVFTFRNKATGEILGRGGEKLAFTNAEGKLIPVPTSVMENAKRFLTARAPELQEIDSNRTLR